MLPSRTVTKMDPLVAHSGQYAVASLYNVQHGLVVHQTSDDDIGSRSGFAGRCCGAGTQRAGLALPGQMPRQLQGIGVFPATAIAPSTRARN